MRDGEVTDAALAAAGPAECPAWLDEGARAEWARVAPALEKLGLLTSVDVALLASYCSVFGKWQRAEEDLQREGLIVTNVKTGIAKANPLVAVHERLGKQLRNLCADLGFSPTSRGRLKPGVLGAERKEDPDQEFLDGGAG